MTYHYTQTKYNLKNMKNMYFYMTYHYHFIDMIGYENKIQSLNDTTA